MNTRKKKNVPKLAIARKPKKQPKQSMTRLGSALRTLGGLGGTALGGIVGMPMAGASTGTSLGAALSKWLGSGDYTIRSNSVVDKVGAGVPMMHQDGQSIIVRHKEYIMDIQSTTAFTVAASFPINPGLSSSFPWLSSVAQQYQEYTIKGLVYHYVPTSGNSIASTNSALGSVILATNYRVSDPVYLNKVQMLNEYFSADSCPSQTFCHPIECNPKENPFQVQYVRTSGVPAGQDQKLYDLATLYVATTGQQAAGNTLGELWCTYEVELKKPILSGSLALSSLAAHYNVGSGTINTTNPLSTATKGGVYDNFIGSLSFTTSGFYLPAGTSGTFLIIVAWSNATAIVINAPTISNGTTFNPASQSSLGWPGATSTNNTNQSIATFYVRVTNPVLSTGITINATTLTAATAVDISVFQVNSSFA